MIVPVFNKEEAPTISPSQMRVWDRCPKQWHYSYVRRIKKKQKVPFYFEFGTYAHELQHVYYQTMKATNGKPGSDFLLAMMRARVMQDLGENNMELIAAVWPRLQQFFMQHSPEIDAGIKVMEAEFEFKVPVILPSSRNIILHGITDLIYLDGNIIRIRDHKTGAKPNSHSSDSVKLDDQLLHYAIALSLYYELPIVDVEINFIHSYIHKDQRPASEIFKLYRYQHTEVGLELAKRNLFKKIDKMFDTEPHLNYSPSCKNCQFFDICHIEMRGLPTESLINSAYSSRDTSIIETTKTSEHTAGNKKISLSIVNV